MQVGDTKMEVKIEQIDGMEQVFRTFYRHATLRNIESICREIARGYNLNHTRVTVDGHIWNVNTGECTDECSMAYGHSVSVQ